MDYDSGHRDNCRRIIVNCGWVLVIMIIMTKLKQASVLQMQFRSVHREDNYFTRVILLTCVAIAVLCAQEESNATK